MDKIHLRSDAQQASTAEGTCQAKTAPSWGGRGLTALTRRGASETVEARVLDMGRKGVYPARKGWRAVFVPRGRRVCLDESVRALRLREGQEPMKGISKC